MFHQQVRDVVPRTNFTAKDTMDTMGNRNAYFASLRSRSLLRPDHDLAVNSHAGLLDFDAQ